MERRDVRGHYELDDGCSGNAVALMGKLTEKLLKELWRYRTGERGRFHLCTHRPGHDEFVLRLDQPDPAGFHR